MHQWARLLSLSLLIYLSSAQNAKPPPKFPKVRDIAETFESSTELTDQIQKATALAKEYYDFQEQSGRLEVLDLGQKITYFFNEKTDQVHTVNDTACVENDGGVAELDLDFYGWTSGKPLYVGPTALIMMKENDPPPFAGTLYVRGILCDWFRSATTEGGKNITIDYYFSEKRGVVVKLLTAHGKKAEDIHRQLKMYLGDSCLADNTVKMVPEWDMPFHEGPNKRHFPVRISISDYSKENDFYEELIDYLYFRPKLNDRSKLQPPVSLGCWLKQPTVKLPFIPKQYTFKVEAFDLLHDLKHADTDVTTGTLWYDYRDKYARIEKYVSVGKVADFHDFKTGVLYHSHDDKTCVVKTMRKSFFLKFAPDSLIGTMKDPYEVLNMQGDDDTFYTMGQEEVRGVKCNVIEKAERDVVFFDVRYYMLVTTVYLSTDSTKIQVEGEDIDFSPPLKIIITGYQTPNKVTLKKQFQIFAFNDEPGRQFFSTYPSAECFAASSQKSYFVILIEASIEIGKELEGNDYGFAELAKNTIINVANITEFRLPFLRADFRPSGIYLTGLMLDKPPILKQFWKEFDEPVFTEKVSAYEIDLDAATEEACAAACLAYSEPCKGFHFCGKGCFINLGEITDEPVDNIPLNLDCYIYIRAVSDSKNDQTSLDEALKRLTTATEKKELKFSAQIKGETGVLTAVQVVAGFNNRGGDDVSSYPYTLVKSGFQFKGADESETTVEVPDAQSEDECYHQCKESTSVACASFSYCAKASTKMCRITSVLLNDGPKDINEILPNAQCDIFSLLYLDFFDRYPGKVIAVPGQKVVDEAYSTEECAKACKEETGFKCRGFEYCKSKKGSCVLHSKHVMDLKPDESIAAKTECVHYAAKFVADYRDMGRLLIDDESNRRIDMTLEECARACSEEVPSCNSFNYCPASMAGIPDSSCSMTSQTLYNAPKTKTKDKCHLYTKREYIEDWSPRVAKGKDGYSRGGFAGLLIGMIILGLVIGALLFVGYSFFRSRRGDGDGLAVKFSKHDNT